MSEKPIQKPPQKKKRRKVKQKTKTSSWDRWSNGNQYGAFNSDD